jgi:fimbrial isopeptide formation D2 family protein
MKKMIKKTSALAISAFMLAQYIPFTAMAVDETNSLTIHPYVLSQADYDTAKANDWKTGDETDVNHVPNKSSYTESTITYNIIQVDADGSAYSGTGTAFSATGVKSATGMPNGYYKLTPNNGTTDSNFKGAEAIYVYLPASGKRNVHIYPKLTDNNNTAADDNTPSSSELHSIKLTKTLTGPSTTTPTWQPDSTATDPFYAEFDAYFKNALGKWEKASPTSTYRTDENGVIQIDGLPLGQYCLVETTAPEGYLLDQTPVVFNLTGAALDAATNASVQTVEVTNDEKPKVKKEVAYTDSGEGYGKTYTWTITADIPSKSSNLLSYTVTDEYTNLADASVNITNVIATDGTTPTTLVAATATATNDYSVNPDTVNDKVTIDLTPAGIAKLSGKTQLIITVESSLDTAGSDVSNEASITYEYAYTPGPTDPEDIPDPDPTDPTNPAYPEDYPGTTPDPGTTATFTPATIVISNVDEDDPTHELTGKFNITNCSDHEDDVSGQDDGLLTDDLLTISNLAPGKYTITQIETEAGYAIANPSSQTIFIDEDGTVYLGEDAATGTDLTSSGNTIVFQNKLTNLFNLPFTGTIATIIFSITGILLMAGTGFLIFILLKKKDDEEEEQENN